MSWLQDYLSQSNKAWDAENQRIGDSYVPDEHTNFIDSFQSGVWGSLAGGAGFLAAGAEKAGFTGLRDWAENEASYAGKRAYANSDKTEYNDSGWYDPRYYVNGHALNDTAQMLGSSLVDIGLVTGSLLAAPETGGASLAGIAAVGAARAGGRIMGEKLLGNVLTKYALEKGATMGLEAGAKLASRQVLGEAALGTAKGLVNEAPLILTGGASESAINAGDVYMESLQMGNDRDTASSQSMQAFGEGYIPAIAEFYADKMAIGGMLAGFATKGGKVLSKAVRSAVANGVVSGQMEGAVEAWQTMVQDRALGKEDALNARIYDPTSWSDNMADAYGQAVGPAMLLGGIGGARAGISSAMNNPNPNVEVTPEVAEQPVSIEGDITPVTDSITPIEEGVAPIEGEISSAPVVDLGGMDSTSPRQGLYDEMRNTFIRNNPKSPDIVETKSQATNDKIEDIVSLWDNSSPEEIQNLAPNTFVEDFKQAGLTDAEAGRASNGLVKHMKEQKPLPKVDGRALIEEASKVGVQLDPKQAENLVSDNPSPALVKQVQNKINKVRPIVEKQQAKLDKKREQEAIAQQQKEYLENEKRNYVNNNYENSTNKQFFDRVIGNTENEPNKAAETAYKFKRAMKERNKDIKNEKPKAKNVRNYLTKQGITEEKYGKTPVQAMVDYARSMDQERINARQSARTSDEYRSSLKESARNVTNVMAVDKMHDDAFKNAHGDQIKSVECDIDNSLIQLGQNGFDITKLKHYKRLENAAKGFHKQAIDRLQRINESVGLAEKVKPVENTPIETKPIEENKPIETKPAENAPIENKPIEETKPVEEKPTVNEPVQEVSVAEKPKRTRTNKPKPYKGLKEGSQFFSGEKTISETMTKLNEMEKDETLKPKEREEVSRIRKLLTSVRDEEGNVATKDMTDSAKQEYNKIISKHKELQDKAKESNIGIQEFTKQASSLKQQAERLFKNFPSQQTLNLVVGSDLVFKVPSQNAMAKAIREGIVDLNKTVTNTFMSKPGNFNNAALKFIEGSFGSKLTKLPNNVRNAIIEKILQNEYSSLIKKYENNEGILSSEPSNLKQLAARIAGSFPTQDFPSIGKEAAESTTAIFGERSKGLANIANDNQGMIGLAREYYQKEEEKIKPKEKVEPKARTTKHQTKAGYTVNKEGIKATISTEMTNDRDYPVTVTVKFDDSKLATDENTQNIIEQVTADLFFDTDDVDIVSNENGVVKLTAKPMLSYTNLSNNVSQEGILKARVESIKKAIELSEQGEIAFTVEENADISALQPILDDLYGKGEYKVETELVKGVDNEGSRKEVYVVNKDTVVDEDIREELSGSALYQRGAEDLARNTDDVATSNDVNAIKDIFKRVPKELRLNDKQIHELTTSLLYWLGRANFPKAVEYLQKAVYLKVNVETGHKPENGYTSIDYGVVRIKPENITATSSTFVHELVHDAVANVLGSDNVFSNNYIKGLFNDMPKKARGRKNERERREAMERLVSGGAGEGIRDLRVLPTGDSGDTGRGRNQSDFGTNAGENRLDWTNDNSQNGLGVPSRSSSNGGSPDISGGPGVRDSSLGSNRLDKTGTNDGEGLQQRETESVIQSKGILDEGWRSTENFLNTTTKEDIDSGIAYEYLDGYLNHVFGIHDLYMSDKAELIGAWLNATLQLDKKHGTNLLEQLRNDELILQETLAYSSHTFMTPSQLGVIFSSGTESMNVEKRQAVIDDPFKKILFVHRMGGTGRAKAKADWRTNEMAATKSLFNISAAATPLDKLMDPSLDKYGQALIVITPKALDKLAYFAGTYDLRSIVDRKYKALRGKYGEEKVKEIINEFFNRGVVNGKGTLGQISLAMFSDISISKEDLKQNLIYRQRKEITSAQMTEFENRIGHMVADLYVKYSNDNKAKYLREKSLPYDKVEKLILDTATYRKDKETGEWIYSEKKGSGKTIISQSFFSGVMNAFRGYAENKGNAYISEMFKKYSGMNSVPDGLTKDLEKIANYMNEFQTTYAEVKFSEDLPANLIHGIYDPNGVLTPEQVKVFRDAGIRVIQNFKGMTVAEYIAREKKSPLLQHGKEDPADMKSNPAEASVNMAEKLIEKEIKKETDRIEVHRRKDNQDNIPMYGLLKEVRSPSSLAKKHFPELVEFIKDARQVTRKTGRDLKEYRTKMDAVYKQLKNKDDQKSFDKLKVEISDRRMEFAQVIPITMQDGTNKYTIIKEGDIFEEFEDESDALQKKVELENAGYKVAKDYKNQRHRIFASKDIVRGYSSLEQANQIAIKESGEIAKSKGYKDTEWNAYVEYRKVLDELMIKAANANERVGNPDKQKYLWGYSPFEHSRFGVYEEQKTIGDDGKEIVTRNVVASFRTEKDARKWVKENLLNNPQFAQSKFAIVEQERNYNNPRNDFDTHYATIDNDYFKDHVVEDFMTEEQKEAEFKRLTGLYPQMKKLVDSGYLNKPMEQKEFLALINNKATMEKLGIDGKTLQEEMKHANAYELFKRNGKVTKKSLIEHFYTNTGSFANNKHNMTRVMGAKGSNPNLQRADYDYIASMVKHINNAEWYHKATTAYEHWFKDKYKANKSTGSMSNKQEMMHTLISTVMGVPNHFDTRLNEVMNEIPELGRFMTKNYGETWSTDIAKRGMEVTALTKLGLLRPTAMFAQLGVMANIFTMTGFNKGFWAAQAAALQGNKNPKYKELFSHIGIGEDYQGIESDVFNDSKSIVNNTKIGRLLAKQMVLFEMGDNFTRRVAAIYAYEKALAKGKTKEEAMSMADDFVQTTNFDYTEIDSPGVFQRAGVVGKMLLQFKKYPVKQMEFFNDILNLMDLPENPSVADIEKAKKERRWRLVRFLGSYAAMAGMLGMPMAGAADELAAWITGSKPSEAMKELMYEWAGKNEWKQTIARFTIYGLPGVAGVDFSRNIGLGDVIPTDASELAGPTFGTLSSMYNAIKYNQSAKNKLIGEIHAIAPFYTNLYQAFGTGKMRDWKAGMDTRDYTVMEKVVKGLGFRPIRESVDADLANILYNKIRETKDAKKASIYKYLDDPTIANMREMERYGVTKKDIESTKASLEADRLDRIAKAVGDKNKSEKFEELRKTRDTFLDYTEEDDE